MELIYKDADVLVVNKPPGMWSEEGLSDEPGVLDRLREIENGEEAFLSSMYPLEPAISGLMLWARNENAKKSLEDQFTQKRLSVAYLALVRATVLSEQGVIDRPVRNSRDSNPRVFVDDKRGTTATTEWKLRDSYVGFALLTCVPRTRIAGQIRAHLENAGLPLAVDPLYGGAEYLKLSSFKAGYRPSRRRPERPLIQRPTLHAWSVSLEQPNTGERLHFEATLPKDLRATLHQLDRFGRIPK